MTRIPQHDEEPEKEIPDVEEREEGDPQVITMDDLDEYSFSQWERGDSDIIEGDY